MHEDATAPQTDAMWAAYFTMLRASGVFEGGSAIGAGESFRKGGTSAPVAGHLVGYIRVTAADAIQARRSLIGNPVHECGGTVEIRALPTD